MYHDDVIMHPISCKGVARQGQPTNTSSLLLDWGVIENRNSREIEAESRKKIAHITVETVSILAGKTISAAFWRIFTYVGQYKKCGRSCPTIVEKELHKSGDLRFVSAFVSACRPSYIT